jgi:hypothetical protein
MSGNLLNRIQPLLHTPDLPELGPGPRSHIQSTNALRDAVRELRDEIPLPERLRQLILALVLLWHDRLEAAHRIVQEIPDADGSFVHAMMHRREPDYWNSKYWWRRVGDHPVFVPLGGRVTAELAETAPELAARLAPGGVWNPVAFVDECQALACRDADDPAVEQARRLQALEFTTLLEHLE